MKKQNDLPNDFDFLLPLKKRNDLEPDKDFVESLRSRLSEGSSKTRNLPGKLRIILASSLAILTFCTLAFSMLDSISTKRELSQKREQRVPATESTISSDPETPLPLEHSYELNKLLKENPYYQNLYQTLSKEINSKEGAEVFILYLHALKQSDMEEIKKFSFTRMESEIEDLIDYYNKVDYKTITIDKAIPSKSDPSYEVHLGYQVSGSSNKEERTIHIHLNDGVSINIFEPNISIE
ncbi:hypothetical protein [Bacillus sp. FJAT-27245]|uniref:hypothetical protein n=1 Tax=Bacillus sp. FJAT-27245 TaxID=1684144 RepID=UPI0006A77F93|nr:hypothetical protein [Bacillus sp. FJAT-27245]